MLAPLAIENTALPGVHRLRHRSCYVVAEAAAGAAAVVAFNVSIQESEPAISLGNRPIPALRLTSWRKTHTRPPCHLFIRAR